MRMSSRQRWLGGSPPRACSAQVTLARDCSERVRRAGSLAHMGEPQAESGCRIAPCHRAAHLLFPGALAAAGNRLQRVTAHVEWGRRREGAL